MTESKTIRVFIVDDHPIVREGLIQLVEREKDLTVCGEAADAPSALEALARLKPDVAVVDISLQGMSGLQLVKQIAAEHKKIAPLVLSMHDERVYAERALRAGAKGYIMKQQATRNVVSAIRQVAQGQVYLSEDLAARMMHSFVGRGAMPGTSPVETLTDRELEVFRLIGQGFKTHQISEKLFLSVKTVETYRENIKSKLNLANATELRQHAIEWVHGEGV